MFAVNLIMAALDVASYCLDCICSIMMKLEIEWLHGKRGFDALSIDDLCPKLRCDRINLTLGLLRHSGATGE